MLSTPVLLLPMTTCTCSALPPDGVGLVPRSWKVMPGIRLFTVFEALLNAIPSTLRLALAPVTVEV